MKNRLLKILIISLLLAVWFTWDIGQANRWGYRTRGYKKFGPVDTITSATSKVSVIPSDYASLSSPADRSADLSYSQIEEMVRTAIDQAGGIDWLIHPGDMVLLKPNIVEREKSGSGEITDVRVVKALIKIINELAPGQIEIVVGEGSPRPMDYEVPYSTRFKSAVWEKLWDLPGYQDLLTDPDLAGINLRLSNLNGSPPENPWKDLVPIQISGGGVATPHENNYYIHKDVLNADVFITVPVLKSHKAGMTCAMKNQIGLAPSTRYGFSKTGGVPQDGYAYKLYHRIEAPRDWVDEEVVDFCTLADIDYAVVDAITCLEYSKEAIYNNGVITNQVRMNTIIAGADPVAVDHVCAKIIGLNPDDLAYLTLAERVGLGTNDDANIKVFGAAINDVRRPFKKDPYYTSDYGQGNRQWILSGPYSTSGISNPMDHAFLANEADLSPQPGQNGWSEEIYFLDDRIDLREYYDDPGDVVSYAACYFTVPKTQTAEWWIGSDEALKIWLNGKVVYDFRGNRSFNKNTLVNDKVRIEIPAGENRLLVKVLQTYGSFDFSLNICEIESNKHFDGNRVSGLKFKTTPSLAQVAAVSLIPEALQIPAVQPGQAYAVEKLDLKTTNGSTNWQGVDIHIGGNTTSADVESIQVWADNGDGIFNRNSDTQLGQGSFQPDKVNVTFSSSPLITSSSQLYFVTLQLPAEEPNPDSRIILSWNNQEDFYFSTPAVVDAEFPITSGSISLPVELISFSATPQGDGVQLVWQIVDEVNLLGYEIQKSLDGESFEAIAFLPAGSDNLDKKQYQYVDPEISAQKSYYRLRMIDTDGSEELSSIIEVTGAVPQDFHLANPYPNPFNGGTRIEFQVPVPGFVDLSVFNMNGQQVKTLQRRYFGTAGSYSARWNGTNDAGAAVSTGMYMVVLRAEGVRQVRKVIYSK